jgi:hypothetical protein
MLSFGRRGLPNSFHYPGEGTQRARNGSRAGELASVEINTPRAVVRSLTLIAGDDKGRNFIGK